MLGAVGEQFQNGTGVKARIAELGGEVLTGSPANFVRLVAKDNEKWLKVIRAANIKLG
jgi:hypothetical protein